MQLAVLFGILFLALVYALRRYRQGHGSLLIWLSISLLVLLAASGRLAALVPLIGLLMAAALRSLPALIQFLPLLQRLWRQRQASTKQSESAGQSSVESRFLRMRLDRANGTINGTVIAGRFAGRELGTLGIEELILLYRECLQGDADSARLVEAYLDRVHGPDWRDRLTGSDRESPPAESAMSRAEAFDILGLAPDASRDAIILAHRRLMQKLHPDRGGSDYLAAKINLARSVLLDS